MGKFFVLTLMCVVGNLELSKAGQASCESSKVSVQMPDGIIVQNVPQGTSLEEVWVRYQANQATRTAGKKVARVVTDGFLVGWKGLFLLTSQHTGGTAVLFDCDNPVLNAKLKEAGCLITPRSATPFIVGRDGDLQGWHVDLLGSSDLHCADPAIRFEEQSIACPQQQSQIVPTEQLRALEEENTRLKSQLAEARAEVAKVKEVSPSPVPFSITVGTPRVHSFLCQAPVLDVQARMLTCYEVSQVF